MMRTAQPMSGWKTHRLDFERPVIDIYDRARAKRQIFNVALSYNINNISGAGPPYPREFRRLRSEDPCGYLNGRNV